MQIVISLKKLPGLTSARFDKPDTKALIRQIAGSTGADFPDDIVADELALYTNWQDVVP